MSTAGLQVFDAKGNLILDSSVNVLKKCGTFTTERVKEGYTSASTGSITDSQLTGHNIAIWIENIELTQEGEMQEALYPQKFEFDSKNAKITWSYNNIIDNSSYWSYAHYRITWGYGWY